MVLAKAEFPTIARFITESKAPKDFLLFLGFFIMDTQLMQYRLFHVRLWVSMQMSKDADLGLQVHVPKGQHWETISGNPDACRNLEKPLLNCDPQIPNPSQNEVILN